MKIGDIIYLKPGSLQAPGFYEIARQAGPNWGFNWGACPPDYCVELPPEIMKPLRAWLQKQRKPVKRTGRKKKYSDKIVEEVRDYYFNGKNPNGDSVKLRHVTKLFGISEPVVQQMLNGTY